MLCGESRQVSIAPGVRWGVDLARESELMVGNMVKEVDVVWAIQLNLTRCEKREGRVGVPCEAFSILDFR
jgi:hypothetical protein